MKEEIKTTINENKDIKEEILDTNEEKNLTFFIEDETYGIQIENVTQIIGIQNITKVPNQPDYVKGVINLRGQIIPVMEVRTKFRKPEIEYDDRTCIIVVSKDDMDVGLIVDRVSEVLNIKEIDIADSPDFNKDVKVIYIRGIAHLDEKVVILIDIDRLLEHEEQII